MTKLIDFTYTIGAFFTAGLNVTDSLNRCIDSFVKYCNVSRLMVHIYLEEAEEIVADIYRGYSDEEICRGKFKVGEGIIGKVIKSGKMEVIPKIKDYPEFLNKTGSRKSIEDMESGFICVPVKIGDKPIGTISADIPPHSGENLLSDEADMLAVLATVSAQAINDRLEQKERERYLIEENQKLKVKLHKKAGDIKIIGQSETMQDLFEKVLLVSETNTTVLITGESGTGKELVAKAIQQASKRKEKPFIKVNIAALPENLIESELFGHEKGAFTGAVSTKKGRFELAEGGTIFLDEIGDLSYSLQVKLLRVLQERVIERVGGSVPIPIDVRVIAATHQDLEKKIEENSFRNDLYYRLNVFPIHVAPLRERKADILNLTDFFIERYSKEYGKNVKRLSTEAINMLVAYHWPGNVRELENCVQRAVIMAEEEVIRNYHLPPTLQMADDSETVSSYEEKVKNFEREIITDYLKMSEGNITRAAKMLGTTKRILTYKVKKLEINYQNFKLNNN